MPEPTTALLLFGLAGQIGNQIASATNRPTPAPVAAGPTPPSRDDPAIEGARRRVIESGFRQGRRRTIIAGAAGSDEAPSVQTQTLLGG